jgi:L-alanine-DL-glutamate epimerase-like enolase superfamily enzyme
LNLLKAVIPAGSQVMVDANEAWGAKEAAMKITAMRAAGHHLLWVEDPILRHDFAGLRLLRQSLPMVQINSGEYLDLSGKRALLMAEGADILNVHAQVSAGLRRIWEFRCPWAIRFLRSAFTWLWLCPRWNGWNTHFRTSTT